MFRSGNPFLSTGIVLILLGIYDIATGFQHFADRREIHISGFGILALLPGIALLMGHVRTARILRSVSLYLFITSVSTGIMVALYVQGAVVHHLLTNFTSYALTNGSYYLMMTSLFGVTYLELSKKTSLAKYQLKGFKTRFPRKTAAFSVALSVAGGILIHTIMTGESARKALELAQSKYGSQYQYQIKTIAFSNEDNSAELWAYDDKNLYSVRVRWQE